MNAAVPSAFYDRVRPHARSLFRTLHQLIGLTLGLVLVSQGLSGAVLVWRPELERAMLPPSVPVAPGADRESLDKELAAVHQAIPAGTVRMVHLAAAPDRIDTWTVAIPVAGRVSADRGPGARRLVYVSQASGRILAVQGARPDLLDSLVELHHSLFLGRLGRLLLGYLAIAAVLLALTGLWLWWPRAWSVSRFRPRASAKPLHYALGFWAMWPLLAIAISALYFVWKQPIQRAFGVAPSQQLAEPPRDVESHRPHDGSRHSATPAGPAKTASLDAITAAAHNALPAEQIASIRFPEHPGDPFTVLCEPPGQHRRTAPDSVAVRVLPDGRPRIDRIQLWNQMPRRRRMLEWLPRIHQAEFGGMPIRILWSLTGCAPAVLYGSGFLMWRRRARVAKSSFSQKSA